MSVVGHQRSWNSPKSAFEEEKISEAKSVLDSSIGDAAHAESAVLLVPQHELLESQPTKIMEETSQSPANPSDQLPNTQTATNQNTKRPRKGMGFIPEWWMEVTPHYTLDLPAYADPQTSADDNAVKRGIAVFGATVKLRKTTIDAPRKDEHTDLPQDIDRPGEKPPEYWKEKVQHAKKHNRRHSSPLAGRYFETIPPSEFQKMVPGQVYVPEWTPDESDLELTDTDNGENNGNLPAYKKRAAPMATAKRRPSIPTGNSQGLITAKEEHALVDTIQHENKDDEAQIREQMLQNEVDRLRAEVEERRAKEEIDRLKAQAEETKLRTQIRDMQETINRQNQDQTAATTARASQQEHFEQPTMSIWRKPQPENQGQDYDPPRATARWQSRRVEELPPRPPPSVPSWVKKSNNEQTSGEQTDEDRNQDNVDRQVRSAIEEQELISRLEAEERDRKQRIMQEARGRAHRRRQEDQERMERFDRERRREAEQRKADLEWRANEDAERRSASERRRRENEAEEDRRRQFQQGDLASAKSSTGSDHHEMDRLLREEEAR